VILFLGTNNLSAADVAEACASLVKVVHAAECGRVGAAPPVLLVCPPPIRATGPDAAEYEAVGGEVASQAVRSGLRHGSPPASSPQSGSWSAST
jgi:hypothetical protein